jgi:saccharopine dehydrogenase (NAD+, L-lysine-forming)
MSKGTAKTVAEGLAKGGAIREDGRIRSVPLAWKTAEIPFPSGKMRALATPWGDVSTAYYSTRIPNIVVYMAMPPTQIRALKLVGLGRSLFAVGALQRFLKRQIERNVRGPDEAMRESLRTELWGRVRDGQGRTIEGTLVTPEAYALTVESSLECVRRVLAGEVSPGAHTPSTAFGARFVMELSRCELRVPGQT